MRDLTPQPGPGHRNHFPDIDEWMASLDLGPDAMAWDIGVHEAHCIRNLARLYPCHIYGFEPQDVLYAPAVEEFAALPNVRLFNFALGERTGDFPMCQAGSSSCSFIGGEVAEEPFIGRMVDVAEFMEQEDIRQVDFCMMNCEGYELILIPHLAAQGLLKRFRNLLIQWHMGWNKAHELQLTSLEALRAYHTLRIDKGLHTWQAWTPEEPSACR